MNNEYMQMLRNSVLAKDTMRAGALQAGHMAGYMAGGVLMGGKVNTKGQIVAKSAAQMAKAKGPRSQEEYKAFDVYKLQSASALGKSKQEYKNMSFKEKAIKVPVSYEEYLKRYQERKQTGEVNDAVLAREVQQRIASLPPGKDGKPRSRLSGRELAILKYDVRNKTKLMKREAKKEGKTLSKSDLENANIRAQYGGGGEVVRGEMSPEEKALRKQARASIANQSMTEAQRSAELRRSYAQAKATAAAEGHGRKFTQGRKAR